jgi:hypothetical protein
MGVDEIKTPIADELPAPPSRLRTREQLARRSRKLHDLPRQMVGNDRLLVCFAWPASSAMTVT